MSEDILLSDQHRCPRVNIGFTHIIYSKALIELENFDLETGGDALTTYGLPTPVREETDNLTPELMLETSCSIDELPTYVNENEPKLLPD